MASRWQMDWPLMPAKCWCFFSAGAQACYYAWLPVVYADMGLRPAQIGVLQGVAPLVSASTMPAWTALADAWSAHREVLCATALISTILHCFLPVCPPRLAVLVPLVLAAEGTFSPAVPLADAAIGLTLHRARRSFADYGKQRLWGAVGWGFVFAPAIGAIEDWTGGTVRRAAPYVGHIFCTICSVLAALRLQQPGDGAGAIHGDGDDSLQLVAADAQGASEDTQPTGIRDVIARLWVLLRSTPGALLHCALFLCVGAAGGIMDTFLFVMLRNMGGGGVLMGLALTMTCVSEVGVFYRAGDILHALGNRGCFLLILGCFWTRLLAYAALPMLHSPWAVMPVQLLHGVTFGLFWQVGNAYMRALAPPSLASSCQGLFQSLNALGSFFGQVCGGLLSQRLGCPAMFFVTSVAMFCVHGAYWAATRAEHKGSSQLQAKQEPQNGAVT